MLVEFLFFDFFIKNAQGDVALTTVTGSIVGVGSTVKTVGHNSL